jgi:hypothetical protein
MHICFKAALALSILLSWVTPSSAGFWDCIVAPEIDGPAGASAIAALISIGMIVYQRYRQ